MSDSNNPAPDWVGFGVAIMDAWPEYDVDSSELHKLAIEYDLIIPVEGGFDPEKHIDNEDICEPGDDWFLFNWKEEMIH